MTRLAMIKDISDERGDALHWKLTGYVNEDRFKEYCKEAV
jgi:hypothetical protein